MLKLLRRLHHDERGLEFVEWVLVVAAIVLPILGVLILYRDDIGKWLAEEYTKVTGRPPPA